MKIVAFAAMVLSGAATYGDNAGFTVRPMKITVETLTAPQARVVGASASNRSSQDYVWLAVTAMIYPKKIAGAFFDDLTLNIEVLLLDPAGSTVYMAAKRSRNPVISDRAVLFKNKIVYHTMPSDGAVNKIMALIPSQILRRYRNLSAGAERSSFVARLIFSDKNGALASGYAANYAISSKEIAGIFRAADNGKYKLTVVDGFPCGRLQTPWAMIDVDEYLMEKREK